MAKVKPEAKETIKERIRRAGEDPNSRHTGIALFAMEGANDGGMSASRRAEAARNGDRDAAQEIKEREKDQEIYFTADFQSAKPEQEIPDKNWDSEYDPDKV